MHVHTAEEDKILVTKRLFDPSTFESDMITRAMVPCLRLVMMCIYKTKSRILQHEVLVLAVLRQRALDVRSIIQEKVRIPPITSFPEASLLPESSVNI
jgi:hypothetical protein